MSKAGKSGSKTEKQQSAKICSSMAEDRVAPLTTETLVLELEKLRRNMTGELTALLNSSLEPIRSSVESFQLSLAEQTSTVREMETSLSDHSDRITQLELDVSGLQSDLGSVVKENTELRAKVEDLESRSKRQNVRVLGLPENVEGKDARVYMAGLFADLLGDLLSEPPELDRAHRSLQPKPRPDDPPRPIIVRFHRYMEKEAVLRWAKSHKDFSYNGHRIKIFEDFSAAVARRRAAFNPVKGLLYQRGVKFGMLYPARLRVTHNNREHVFNSPEAAESFYRQNFPAKETSAAE